MDHAADNSRLNDLLVELNRSLTQYVMEAWPWSRNQSGSLRDAVKSAAALQAADVAKLAQLLSQRGVRIDFGVYPHVYTSLHYVAIEYLARQLVEGQKALVKMLERAQEELLHDAAAQAVLGEIITTQREASSQLSAATSSTADLATAWMK